MHGPIMCLHTCIIHLPTMCLHTCTIHLPTYWRNFNMPNEFFIHPNCHFHWERERPFNIISLEFNISISQQNKKGAVAAHRVRPAAVAANNNKLSKFLFNQKFILFQTKKRKKVAKTFHQFPSPPPSKCDQMTKLFFNSSTINNYENFPNSLTFLPK